LKLPPQAAASTLGRRIPIGKLDAAVTTAELAKAADLRYVSDSRPGITRRARGKNFDYYGSDGKKVTDEATLRRIKRLAIPPAWTEVWICPDADGHLQAVGTDVAGRRQYLYHQRWRARRDRQKFDRMLDFARALPRVRRVVARDLAEPEVTRERLYLETMESVLSRSHKVFIDSKGVVGGKDGTAGGSAGTNVFYLPLDKLLERGNAPETNAQPERSMRATPAPDVETVTVEGRARADRQ